MPSAESAASPADPLIGPEVFVSAEWLAGRLDDPSIVVFDASYFPDGVDRDAGREFVEQRIPGARRFDIRGLSDPGSPYPNMLPRPADLETLLRESGVGRDTVVVLYDSLGLYGAARALWTLRSFGVESCRVLAGGLPGWIGEGRPISSGVPTADPVVTRSAPVIVHGDPVGVADRPAVRRALGDGVAQLLDARGSLDPAGRPPLPVPGFARAPHDAFVHDGRLDPVASIRETAWGLGIRVDEPVIVTCGTGVAASVTWLALASAGFSVRLYDGGFAEWATERG